MTQLINLMPKEYRQKLGDHRVRRSFLLQTTAALVLVAVLGMYEQHVLTMRRAEVAQALKKVGVVAEAEKKLTELDHQKERVINQIAQYEHTAIPIDLSRVIGTVSKLIPGETSINSMRIWVERIQVSKSEMERMQNRVNAARSGKEQESETHRILMSELTGVAKSDIQISVLLENLETHPLFQHVQLDYSKAATLNDTEIREFRVVFEIDLEHRYLPPDSDLSSQEND